MRSHARRLIPLLLPLGFALADDDLAEKVGRPDRTTAGGVEIPDPGLKVEDHANAQEAVVRFQKEVKEVRKDDEKVIEKLAWLGGFDHPLIHSEAKKWIKDRNHNVAVAAVVVIARQASDREKAGSTLLATLKAEKRTNLICACLVGMGRLGYDNKAAYREAEKYFAKDTGEAHKAATRYFGYLKSKEAFRMLAEKLDEPRSSMSPDDPRNPPASYWKERWVEWAGNVYYTRWALAQIVEGETFEATKEAQQWAESVGKEYGIKW